MMKIRLIACLLACFFSAAAVAQVGPPVSDEVPAPRPSSAPVAPVLPMLEAFPSATPAAMNPLTMLDAAGSALPSSGGAAGEQKSGLSTAVNILVVLTVITLAPSIML